MDYVRILGSSGTKTADSGMTSIQISPKVVIDAGNLIEGLGEDISSIEHIFLTHSHLDHILDIPFILDLLYERQERSLNVYGLAQTIETVKETIFNNRIFPDFSRIKLLDSHHTALKFHEISCSKSYKIDGMSITPFPTRHTVASCGYIVRKGKFSIMFTSDTGPNGKIWEILDSDSTIKTLITEVSFPSSFEKLALASGHYTPKLLAEDMKSMRREDLRVFVMHLKPLYYERIEREIDELELLKNGGAILKDGSVLSFEPDIPSARIASMSERFDKLVQTAIALSAEHDHDLLNEKVLQTAMELTGADGGTLYLLSEGEESLEFKVLRNISMGISLGGSRGKVDWTPVPLYDEDGRENHSLVAAHCALEKRLINIPDVYSATEGFDFRNTELYDSKSGYHSKSMLVAPLLDYDDKLIGVIQLLNKIDSFGKTIAFDEKDEKILTALGSQAAVSINNQKLISDLEELFESFLATINLALDEKSPYTAGHIGRMVELSMMLAEAINDDEEYFAQIEWSEDEIKTIRLAAMMHDIGKITTPVYVMDKATKLQSIFDKIELIKLRMQLYGCETGCEAFRDVDENPIPCEALDEEFDFLQKSNEGGEFFDDEKIKRIEEIASHTLYIDGRRKNLLDDDEVKNLTIRKGTLSDEERNIINNHAAVSLKMLQSIHFPKKYSRVPEIAGSHHEKINGKGYPKGLKGEEISFEARILAVADIFEALTASDRPYKKSKKLSESMKILWFMAKDNEIDREICRFFYEKELYLEYARRYLPPENIDEVKLDFTFAKEE